MEGREYAYGIHRILSYIKLSHNFDSVYLVTKTKRD